MIPKWLKPIKTREDTECSECHEDIKINKKCYVNKNFCVWCIKCAKEEN